MSNAAHTTPFLRLGRMLLALAVCASLGLHWAVLQTVAWTQMLVTYSQDAELGEAVQKTFDGEHPCNLCLLVKRGQNEEKKRESVQVKKSLDAVLVKEEVLRLRFAQAVEFPCIERQAAGWGETPPVPPPRT